MDKQQYIKSLTALLYFKNVPLNEKHNDFLFNLLKDDFTNEQFNDICMDICKTEELFNKYPDPKLFYDRKPKDKSNMVMIVEGQFYLDDSMPEYKEYLKGTTDEEQLRIWKWIVDNKYGQEVSKDWIIERIIQFRKPKETEWLSDNGLHLVDVIKKIEG